MSGSEQYWVVAADGKEYGPADLETLRLWVREGRVVQATHIRPSTGPTLYAGKMPELADLLPPHGAAGAGPPPHAPGPPATPLPAEFRVWEFIGRAWDLVKRYWLVLGAMFFIQGLIIGGPNIAVHYMGTVVQFVIGGAIMVGIWRAILGVVAGRKPDVGMMFQGFDRFADAFLGYLVMAILTALGFVCLIVPGIILAIMWLFTFPVIGETGLGFWEAMRESARLTEGYRWRLFLLLLAFIPVTLLGALVCCVGVFISTAVNFTALALAYRFLQEKKRAPATPGPATPAPAAP
ncbi:MAG: hypothetical protein AUH92_06820 [Acidobacteria bacterium 13_1_40CM_4_69_4]|nr:MAG: hypothetical protein AUH92_06820 [Acidobacteria bacterium 13_1_40CM_4_69_4]